MAEPIVPNSPEEWDLEQAVFDASNREDVPEWARDVVRRLWREFVAREDAVLAYLENIKDA